MISRSTGFTAGVRAALLLLVALTVALPAQAQIYRVVTKDGVIFTDQPPPEGPGVVIEQIEIRDINTAPAPEARPQAATSAPASEPAPGLAVTITAPVDETTIAMGPGDFAVSARADPPLGRQEKLLLLIDGQPWGQAQSGSSWMVRGALRGPHDLVVERHGGQRVTARSESVRVYVLRPSVLRR